MGVRTKVLIGSITAVLVSAVVPVSVLAQTAPDDSLPNSQTLNEEFEDEFFGASGTFFQNQGLVGSVTWLLGPFPENNVIHDASDLHDLYAESMEQQGLASPPIRTADLNNPFESSLLLLPPSQPLRPTPAPRINFEPPVLTPGPASVAPAAAPARPVRGLW